MKKRVTFIFLNLTIWMLSSCIMPPSDLNSSRTALKTNDPSASSMYGSRVWDDNPIAITENDSLSPTYKLNQILSDKSYFIVDNPYLFGTCFSTNSYPLSTSEQINECIKVYEKSGSSPISYTPDKKWAFETDSPNFLQVHTFHHLKQIVNRFHDSMYWAYLKQSQINTSPYNIQAFPNDLTSNIFSEKSLWMLDIAGNSTPLNIYSSSDIEDNSYFEPATFSISFGRDSIYTDMNWVEDPSVIYHETGHAFIQIMLNLRNNTGIHTTEQTDFGYIFYDEAGAIGEGLTDYFSHAMNGRERFSEWALGLFNNASRPMSESDSLHMGALSKTAEGRLSYPTYISYDPNNHEQAVEDVHFGGLITSHYLVALTQDLQNKCNFEFYPNYNKTRDKSKKYAVDYILYAMTQTLAELGDLKSKGSNNVINSDNYPVNLHPNHAQEWVRISNPINYRKFFQTFTKHIYLLLNNGGASTECNGTVYQKDYIEQLLDQYGLLLFDTYNLDGNGYEVDEDNTLYGHSKHLANTQIKINPSNRLKTTLVTKDHIGYQSDPNATKAFIFDNRQDVMEVIGNLKSGGQIADANLSSLIPTDLSYNNGNSKISPGEIVGILPNLFNSSNSEIGGVQILANDWDHTRESKPCNSFADDWPLDSEGAAATGFSTVAGDCEHVTKQNGDELLEEVTPVCFVKFKDENETKWISQELYPTLSSNIGPEHCLGGADDTAGCLVRFIKGADQAYYSKINAQSTWASTLAGSDGTPIYKPSNILFMEVSPWVPPGTTIDCRLRLRFTNCSDCWQNSSYGSDDYLDYQYSGDKPFKIIHLQFDVIN